MSEHIIKNFSALFLGSALLTAACSEVKSFFDTAAANSGDGITISAPTVSPTKVGNLRKQFTDLYK